MPSLAQAISDLNESLVMELVKYRLDMGATPLDIVEECRNGMIEVGERYSRGEYFLGDLVLSAEIFHEVMQVLAPALDKKITHQPVGKIVFGTVEGDIHDIGKNITISLLRCHGFEVWDLGVNVPPDKFIHCLKETGASILCLSILLSSCFEALQRTVSLVRLFDNQGKIKILIGGLVNERVREYSGADGWVTDARKGVTVCQKWMGVL
ncbi:cobalamin B12-binding domain-containing protein [Desulfofundulus thermosubterraneus]|uniref:Methanogenic corrinoid protein MtbC1 n=1 Tax=Desulfofundulus thermosubterraneus DSM 16057 TaxID=1121432 RepID=A0A1M6MDI2_9FIRM|nr:cobalamin-dependent protein [Desulfofundulus thermosubterraneus]SHJ81507.1 Methanogenic corrinoid protein MtbC1 [Desulfofundulus thermosubterraneus DSM 16057]